LPDKNSIQNHAFESQAITGMHIKMNNFNKIKNPCNHDDYRGFLCRRISVYLKLLLVNTQFEELH